MDSVVSHAEEVSPVTTLPKGFSRLGISRFDSGRHEDRCGTMGAGSQPEGGDMRKWSRGTAAPTKSWGAWCPPGTSRVLIERVVEVRGRRGGRRERVALVAPADLLVRFRELAAGRYRVSCKGPGGKFLRLGGVRCRAWRSWLRARRRARTDISVITPDRRAGAPSGGFSRLLERAQARVAATAAVATQWRRKVARRDAQIRSERGEHRVERRRLQTECRVARQEARVALRERGATTRYAEAQEAAREVTDRRADALRVELEAAQQEILVLKRRAAENDRARRRGCRLATADRAALIEARETAAAADTRSRQFETVSAQLRGYVDQMEDELRQLAAVRARESDDWAGLPPCGPRNTWRRYGCSAIALLQRWGAGGSSRDRSRSRLPSRASRAWRDGHNSRHIHSLSCRPKPRVRRRRGWSARRPRRSHSGARW